MSTNSKITRRKLLQTAAVLTPIAMTGCATAGRDGVHDVLPDSEPPVRTTDPVARSLAYYSDTRDVAADNPLAATHDVTQSCSNCVHSRDSLDADRGSRRLECPMFPGRSVSKQGWCSIWAQG